MFDANSISTKKACSSYLWAGSEITLTTFRHEINWKTEMSYAIA